MIEEGNRHFEQIKHVGYVASNILNTAQPHDCVHVPPIDIQR